MFEDTKKKGHITNHSQKKISVYTHKYVSFEATKKFKKIKNEMHGKEIEKRNSDTYVEREIWITCKEQEKTENE